MVCRDQVLFADFTKKGVNGAYTPTGLLKISPLSFRLVSHGGNSTIFFELGVSIYEIFGFLIDFGPKAGSVNQRRGVDN